MKMRARKGEGAVTLEELAEHAAGLICLTGDEHGPLAAALENGEKVAAGAAWRILVSRYNYSAFFGQGDDEIEYSMTPALSKTSYHLIDEYATLHLQR